MTLPILSMSAPCELSLNVVKPGIMDIQCESIEFGGIMALLQTTIDDEVKERADKVFARSGLTTAMATRVMVTQVANTGISPFDGLFSTPSSMALSDEVRIAMLREEAIEAGLIPDDSFDASTMPTEILDLLEVTEEEVAL